MSALQLVREGFGDPVSLSAGISRLERGGPCPGLAVDLGDGDIARADGPLGEAGLIQRLLGHRLLVALAGDPPLGGVELPDRQVDMTPLTRELLDLARPIS